MRPAEFGIYSIRGLVPDDLAPDVAVHNGDARAGLPQKLGRLLERRIGEADEDEGGSFPRKRPRNSAPNSGADPGDDGRFAD